MRPTLFTLWLLALVVAAPAARGSTVTVVGVEGDRLSSPALANVSENVVRGAMAVSAFDVTDSSNVTLTELMLLVGCSGVREECMAEIASALGTDLFVFGYVRGEGPATLELTLFDAHSGLARFTTPLRVHAGLAADVAVVLSGRTLLHVTAEAPGGVVTADGSEVRLPATLTVSPGRQVVVVRFDDGRVVDEVVDVGEVPGELEVELSTRRRPVAGGDDARRRVSPSSLALGTLGAASLGVSGVFMARLAATEAAFDDTPFQREAHTLADRGGREAAVANATLAAGGALIVASVVMAIAGRDGSDRDEAERPDEAGRQGRGPRPTVAVDGAALHLRW